MTTGTNDFENTPYTDYRSFLRWLSRKRESCKHQLEVLKARDLKTEQADIRIFNVSKRIVYLQQKIKEINADYKELDHRNF